MKINILQHRLWAIAMCCMVIATMSNALSAQDNTSTIPTTAVLTSPTNDWSVGTHKVAAVDAIQANHQIGADVHAELKAGKSIHLKPNFQAKLGSQCRFYIEQSAALRSEDLLLVDEASTDTESLLIRHYPNPFQQKTTIEYVLPESGKVSLRLYDVTGQLQAILLNGVMQNTGIQEFVFDKGNLSSGIYLYQLRVGEHLISKKMIIR